MKNITASDRKNLKSRAHHLKPVIQIGRNGITPSLISALDKALLDHELIKIKFQDFKEEKRDLANEIAEETGCAIISMMGNILTVYRENEEDDK
ncbi:MAG: YhbY family RNA-binding protein [Spirochaetes bacterium]|nr:YhbY family RNA-binding protein [Spirochaetota bacterium]